jgi:hypothetical protein
VVGRQIHRLGERGNMLILDLACLDTARQSGSDSHRHVFEEKLVIIPEGGERREGHTMINSLMPNLNPPALDLCVATRRTPCTVPSNPCTMPSTPSNPCSGCLAGCPEVKLWFGFWLVVTQVVTTMIVVSTYSRLQASSLVSSNVPHPFMVFTPLRFKSAKSRLEPVFFR